MRFGSVCSGIEAASVAWEPLGWRAIWLSEVDGFASQVMKHHWPHVPNLGDMTSIEERIDAVGVPDVLVGGTPCQSFSVAGLRGGLDDDRGSLTLSYVRLYRAIRDRNADAIALWENVPGVLSSKDNAFGHFLAGLVGAGEPLIPNGRWGGAGVAVGPDGAAAWRVLDSQHFGVPQRRRRVYVVACDSIERACEVLFEREGASGDPAAVKKPGVFVYRIGDDAVSRCLTAHGVRLDFKTETFIFNSALRKMTPVELERLQGFPDDHTSILSDAQRYKTLGNSMTVPVIRWIGDRIKHYEERHTA